MGANDNGSVGLSLMKLSFEDVIKNDPSLTINLSLTDDENKVSGTALSS